MKNKLNVGILGFGTVGAGVAKVLVNNAEIIARRVGKEIALKHVADLDTTRDRGIKLPSGCLINDAEKVINDPDIDIIVEAIGGVNPAKKFIEQALKNKKHVVTPNKEVMAKHGQDFIALAKQNNVNIYFEAAVCGGIPIINALNKALAANNIKKLFGIVNGTTNFILTKMYRDNAEFSAVLKEAQQLGYAEADPTNDVEGFDAVYKLAILAGVAFNTTINYKDIYCEGITKISAQDIALAKEFGYVIKLLATGISRPEGLELRVHPVMIKADHPLAAVNDAFNAVFVEGDAVGETMFYGRGAGELPTASAVVGDVIDIAMTFGQGTHPALGYSFSKKAVIPIGDIFSKYFIRMTVKDQPGVLAAISSVCGEHNVSIKSVQQKEAAGVQTEIVIITHSVKESGMQSALQKIKALDSVIAVNSVIRAGL
jgi:homoserine dehydrogenase